jgi:hypothetical protein
MIDESTALPLTHIEIASFFQDGILPDPIEDALRSAQVNPSQSYIIIQTFPAEAEDGDA